MSGASPVKGKFQPEGKGYDYASAKAAGMGPTGDGTAENKGHWGSVILASDAVRAKYNLPDESYMVLKGRSHETFFKAVLSEQARGSKIIKRGNRYFSVPKSFSGKGEFKDVFKGMDDWYYDKARHSNSIRSRIMPKVVTKDGKTRTFAYSKAGMSAAKEYAKQYGGRVAEVNMKTTMLKKKK
jgi:hypothetical protein